MSDSVSRDFSGVSGIVGEVGPWTSGGPNTLGRVRVGTLPTLPKVSEPRGEEESVFGSLPLSSYSFGGNGPGRVEGVVCQCVSICRFGRVSGPVYTDPSLTTGYSTTFCLLRTYFVDIVLRVRD